MGRLHMYLYELTIRNQPLMYTRAKNRWHSYHGTGLYKPCINQPFGDCAMYFDFGVGKYTDITCIEESPQVSKMTPCFWLRPPPMPRSQTDPTSETFELQPKKRKISARAEIDFPRAEIKVLFFLVSYLCFFDFKKDD